MEKLRVIELFSGVGCQREALNRAGIKHDVVGMSEIDKFAIDTYTQLHGETYNFGDISKINYLPKVDLWTYSFPCTDISTAGKQEGIVKGTRSGLLLEVERLLDCSEKPKYLLMENVKNLVSKKFKPAFDKWCEKLESLGYTNYWKVLNSKDFGIPQNRERVFMVSVLGEHTPYEFPKGRHLTKKLKHLLDEKVDDKYFLSEEIQKRFTEFPKDRLSNDIDVIGTTAPNPRDSKGRIIYNKCTSSRVLNTEGICSTLSARDYKQPIQIRVNYICEKKQNVSVSDFMDKKVDEKYYKLKPSCKKHFDLEYKDIVKTDKEIYQCKCKSGFQDNKVGVLVAPTLRAGNPTTHCLKEGKIRKLTPKECWRLMGWSDKRFNTLKGISNTQLYKQAGNGIVVDVLQAIFENLFKGGK